MRGFGCVPFLMVILLLVLTPIFFAEIMGTALLKLHLSPGVAAALVPAIFLGGLINIPVKRIVRTEGVVVHPLAVFGLFDFFPQLRQVRRETIIAVNVGGCLVPTGIALYEVYHLLPTGAAGALATASLANIVVCYVLARPVPNLGIAMPAFVPPVVAALAALVTWPEQATPVAFVAGVMGPLVGADLLHLRDIERIATGVASIGGAGTFDGIVLSGIVAVYLA